MGHLLIDDRASGGKLREYDTVSCKHCQAVIKIEIRPKTKMCQPWCDHCFGHVCNAKACASLCVPFFRKIDEKLRRQAYFRAIGLG